MIATWNRGVKLGSDYLQEFFMLKCGGSLKEAPEINVKNENKMKNEKKIIQEKNFQELKKFLYTIRETNRRTLRSSQNVLFLTQKVCMILPDF